MIPRRVVRGLAVALLLFPGLAGSGLAQEPGGVIPVDVLVRGPEGPIDGAVVRSGAVSGLTGPDGRTVLRLPAGAHEVVAERIGFATTRAVLDVAEGASFTLDMRPEALETEGLVVTSGRTDRRIEEEPLRIEAVSREEVEEKLLMTPGDIAMLLNETAGLRVQPTAPSLGGASVRIQGLRGRYTQILTDGMPLYGGQAGALGPLQVPPMDLARVEVIKGAASALYGPTALGGVVNLISRPPDRARELILNQSTLGGTDAIAWLADRPGERWGYTLLLSGHRQDYADVDDDRWADVPHFRRVSARPRLFFDDGDGGTAILTVGGMLEDRTGGNAPGDVWGPTPFPVESLDTRRVDAGFSGRRTLGGSRLLTARLSGSLQGHDHWFGGVNETDEHRTAFGEVALSGHDGRHLWVVGAALQHDGYEHDQLPAFSFRYTVPGIFAQDEVRLSDIVAVSASARFDRHSRFGSLFSPRASVLARPAAWAIRLSAGTGYFAPTPFTEAVEAVGLSRLTEPTGWVEERARSAMMDVGRTFGPVEVNASAFASVIDDPLQTVRNGDGTLTIRNATEGSVETHGVELFSALRTGPWRLIVSHAFLESTEPDPEGTGRREVPLTPKHSSGLVGAYEREGWGRVGIEAYYTGVQQLDDDPYRSESRRHVVVGFLVDRRLGPFRVFLNAENILDTRQTRWDPLPRPGPTADGRWITDVWAPLEGRAFNGGVWISR